MSISNRRASKRTFVNHVVERCRRIDVEFVVVGLVVGCVVVPAL